MPARAADHVGAFVLLLATVAGLWLGLAGPDTSPVQPAVPPAPVLGALRGLVLGGGGGS
jgi:hypothetical protein